MANLNYLDQFGFRYVTSGKNIEGSTDNVVELVFKYLVKLGGYVQLDTIMKHFESVHYKNLR